MTTLTLRRPAPAAMRPEPVAAASREAKRPAALGIAETLQRIIGSDRKLADLAPVLEFTVRSGGLEWLPLQIGFLEVLCDRIGATDEQRRRISVCLARWTCCTGYLRTLASDGAVRFDIDGRAGEPVSSDHQLGAAVRLTGMDALHAKVKTKQS